MRFKGLSLFAFGLLFLVFTRLGKPVIESPLEGQVLRGIVAIQGTTDIRGFESAEISYSYDQNDPGTWFLIQQNSQATKKGLLANWDTTIIADGNYRIRLRVYLEGTEISEVIINNLRVRNYSVVETETPHPSLLEQSSQVTVFPTQTIQALDTPTPLPTNPAEISYQKISSSVFQGTACVVIIIGLLFFYLALRSRIKN